MSDFNEPWKYDGITTKEVNILQLNDTEDRIIFEKEIDSYQDSEQLHREVNQKNRITSCVNAMHDPETGISIKNPEEVMRLVKVVVHDAPDVCDCGGYPTCVVCAVIKLNQILGGN